MHRLVLVVVSLIAAAACEGTNPASCQLPENMGIGPCAGVGGPCNDRSDCAMSPDKPVCDTSEGDGVCVQCTADDDASCMGTTPRCESRICVACVDDGDCGASGVCLSTGDCAAEDRIIHAKASGGMDTTTCGAVGSECTLTRALTVVTASKNIIKLDDDAVYTAEVGFLVDVEVPLTIAARGATLSRGGTGPVLTINDDRNATILGGTITGAHGSNGDGVFCKSGAALSVDGTTITANEESAIDADQCTLRIKKAVITGNSTTQDVPAIDVTAGLLTMWLSRLSSNRGGGVNVTNNGNVVIVGNLFHDNGVSGNNPSALAGLFITTTTASTNRLEFNTIVDNRAGSGLAQGIQCNTSGFTARNNIIWSTTAITDPLIIGTCTHAYSDIKQVLSPPVGGDGIFNLDPLFGADFRVSADSPVKEKADPASNLTDLASVDLAGLPRTARADVGAYQVPRP